MTMKYRDQRTKQRNPETDPNINGNSEQEERLTLSQQWVVEGLTDLLETPDDLWLFGRSKVGSLCFSSYIKVNSTKNGLKI